MNKRKILLSVSTLFVLLWVLPAVVLASESNGTIISGSTYAWGENLGWLNFGAIGSNVSITDSALSGYVWTANDGWINLRPTNGGVTNSCSGALGGYAWGEGVGWIDFSGVTIDAGGNFAGMIGATSTLVGRIAFSCDNCSVKTDWRPCASRPACSNTLDDDGDGKIDYPTDAGCSSAEDTSEVNASGGGSSGGDGGGEVGVGAVAGVGGGIIAGNSRSGSGASTAIGGFTINNGVSTTNSREVSLGLVAYNTTQMMVSNSPDFSDAKWVPFDPLKKWTLDDGYGVKTVYVKFKGVAGDISAAKVVTVKLAPALGAGAAGVSATAPIVSGQTVAVGGVSFSVERLASIVPPAAPITKQLGIGIVDTNVITLQRFLNTNGYALTKGNVPGAPGKEIDRFGALTRVALRKFQADNGLAAESGTVGPKTMALMNDIAEKKALLFASPEELKCPVFAVALRPGDSGLEVYKIQKFLSEKESIKIDAGGVYNEATKIAVGVFQDKYANNILRTLGLTSPTGLWLKSTIAKANELFGCR